MADEQAKPADKPEKKGGGVVGIVLGILIPAALAAGGGFGGARLASASHAPAHAPEVPAQKMVKAPGPTLALEPFVTTISDSAGRAHALKLTIALELEPTAKEEAIKPFLPRLRDSTLSYLRTMTFEEASDNARVEALRTELLERYVKLGVVAADKILITDFVAQ
jgi:flagellar basal body-associated protein FliL